MNVSPQNELVRLLRISYGDEHWRSGTPGIKVTERNKRTSSKPNYKGWLRPNDLRILCRAYTNDCFGFLRRRGRLRELLEAKRVYWPAVERRDLSSLPKIRTFERTSVFVCFALRTQTKPDETESIQIVVRTKIKIPERIRIIAEARWLAFLLGFVRIPE